MGRSPPVLNWVCCAVVWVQLCLSMISVFVSERSESCVTKEVASVLLLCCGCRCVHPIHRYGAIFGCDVHHLSSSSSRAMLRLRQKQHNQHTSTASQSCTADGGPDEIHEMQRAGWGAAAGVAWNTDTRDGM